MNRCLGQKGKPEMIATKTRSAPTPEKAPRTRKMTADETECAEEGHIWEEALRRKQAPDSKYIPMSEIWTPEHGLRNPL